MRLYLDEDIGSRHLGQVLRKKGHDVVLPSEAGQLGHSDIYRFGYAVERDRVFITGNHRDFQDLHDLVMLCRGSHPGIFSIRKDNDLRRDMKANHIVTAIKNVSDVMASFREHLVCLNDWR
jgi:predicted nuclease of predicted toxin-antitoxin system